MSETPLHAEAQGHKPPGKSAPNPAMLVLKLLASLRITVVLFALSIVLVFYGTLAQKEQDIWDVVNEYFWSWCVFIPNRLTTMFLQLFFDLPPSMNAPGSLPFPGGKLIFWAIAVNLLAAHATRLRVSWERSGVLLIHAGLVLMMVGEFLTREFAVESTMTLVTGGKASFVESNRHVELAFIDASDKENDKVVVVPGTVLERAARTGQPIDDPRLPCSVTVLSLFSNSDIRDRGKDEPEYASRGEGKELTVLERPRVNGVDQDQKVNMPAALVRLTDRDGTDLGTWLVSTWLQLTRSPRPQKVAAKEGERLVSLRFRRTYKPYTITLEEFRHEVYPGTNKPRNFQSDIRLEDSEIGVDRPTTIRMNEPMRHRGETFYQHQALAGDSGSVLQVVRNPGWLLPYLSCAVVSLGMLVHFGINLSRFLRRTT
ncbi:MAG: cytochrome c biogenesis protein ResB [Planctomycetes bacterium]|nr:cytochrome c biogenesis protein ResB [Planctomycetota bacterium]